MKQEITPPSLRSLSKQDFAETLSLCKKYLQNGHEDTYCLADKNTYDYFKQLALQKRAQTQSTQVQASSAPVTKQALAPFTPPVVAIVAPQKLTPTQVDPPRKEELKQNEPIKNKPVLAQAPIVHVSTPHAPAPSSQTQTLSLPLMPRPFVPAPLPPFGDMKEKVAKLAPQLALNTDIASDEVARKKTMAWKDNYPQFAILSFFPQDSEEHAFLKNVSNAVNTRLRSCTVYEASSAIARELTVLAQTEHLKAVVLAAAPHTLSKANEFLLQLSLEQAPEIDFSPLNAKGMLYDTPIFELLVTKEIQAKPDEKLALWKMLTRISTAS